MKSNFFSFFLSLSFWILVGTFLVQNTTCFFDLLENLLGDEDYEDSEVTSIDLKFSFVKFFLYTAHNRFHPQRITFYDVESENFNPKLPVKIISHGWNRDATTEESIGIKNAYLSRSDFPVNVIVTDWSFYGKDVYSHSARRTEIAGIAVAKLIRMLMKTYNMSADDFHLIGHSLGSHVMGYAGKNMRTSDDVMVGRITGLDPAGPCFEFYRVLCKDANLHGLSYRDAKFVDIIHTCAAALGYVAGIGHADFYPNKGVHPQPGCDHRSYALGHACSHERSYQFFIESIHSPELLGYPCLSPQEFNRNECRFGAVSMGETANHDARGWFYLRTNSKPIYGLGNLFSHYESLFL